MGAVVLNGVGVLVYVGDIVGTGVGGMVQCKVVRRAGFGEGSGVDGGVAIGAGVRMCVVVSVSSISCSDYWDGVGESSGRVDGVGTCVVGVACPVWRRCTVVGAALICF